MPGFAFRVHQRCLEQAAQESGEDQEKSKLVNDLHLRVKMLENEKARLEAEIRQGKENLPSQHLALVKTLEARADLFLSRNKAECVERVFHKHADEKQELILQDKLGEAFHEFGVNLSADEVQALITMMDIDKNGGLDLKEFTAALRQPFTPVEQFLQTLPISGILASCLVTPESAPDSLEELCNLGWEQLKAAIHAFSSSLEHELKRQLDNLKSLVDAKEAKAQEEADGSGSKSAVFVMNAGTVEEFYKGPYERIGEHCNTPKIWFASSQDLASRTNCLTAV